MDAEQVADKLITDKEAAEYLRLSPKTGYQTIQKWVRKGALKAGRSGSHYLFRKQDLDDFLFKRK